MADDKRRHIAVSPQQRRQLEEAKNLYEQERGHTDWGTFLAIATGMGLAALGVYALARTSRRNATTWQVACPKCETTFPLVSQSLPAIAQVMCPKCDAELVLDFESSPNSLGSDNDRLNPGEPVLVYCHHCGRQSEVRFWGISPQTFRCPVCGGVAVYGMGQIQQQQL